jgi:hypothetical protein
MKEIVQCPICKTKQEDEECTFATVKRVVDDVTYVCCCEVQAKRVNKK